MKQRKNYSQEFKKNAVSLSQQSEDLGTLALELGIHKDLLYAWRSEFRKKSTATITDKASGGVSGKSKIEQEMQKKLTRLEQENEILKKALGIISKSEF